MDVIGHDDVVIDEYFRKVGWDIQQMPFGEPAKIIQVQLGTVKTVAYNTSKQVLLVLGANGNEIIAVAGVIKGFQAEPFSVWVDTHKVTLLYGFSDGFCGNGVHTAERSRPLPTRGMCGARL